MKRLPNFFASVTPARVPWAVALVLVPCAAASIWFALTMSDRLDVYNRFFPGFAEAWNASGLPVLSTILRIVLLVGGALTLVGALGAILLRTPRGRTLVVAGCVSVYVLAGFYMTVALMGTGLIGEKKIKIDGAVPDIDELFAIKMHFIWPAIAAAAGAFVIHRTMNRRLGMVAYGAIDPSQPAHLEARFGADEALRRNMAGSFSLHVVTILILPLILRGVGCSDTYLLPGGANAGGGGAQQASIKVTKVVKPKQQKKILFRANSAISFYKPVIDDSEIRDDMEETTENEYVAGGAGLGGGEGYGEGTGKGFGKGSGSGGGWGTGSGEGLVRFIRLEHSGAQWDDGMDTNSGADLNFLREVHKISKFKIAPQGEAIPVRGLKRFKAGQAPPFVYLTGNGRIEGFTATDIRTLREYIRGGGMLFADAGSPEFDTSFRHLMTQVLPDYTLVDVPDDDHIYKVPFSFPNGAPPLWHHGGKRAMGVKMEGRWGVYYFPGDVNDAWKSGNSGLSAFKAKRAFELGINVLYHAFTNYSERAG